MIALDGNNYEVSQKAYKPILSKPKSANLGMTGQWLVVESAINPKQYELTLIVTIDELRTLRISYAKGGIISMTDEEGNEWNPLGSGTGHLNTGVFFSPETSIATDPVSQLAMTSRNRFLQPIKLIVNDTAYNF